MLALKRLPEKHTLIKLAAQTIKRTQNKQEGGKDGGTNNNMCSASASVDTVINKSTLYVQSGLKYNNLCDTVELTSNTAIIPFSAVSNGG